MKQFNSREELLQDAINYYWGKTERRSVTKDGTSCQYIATPTSEGCAIGRLLEPELAEELPYDAGVSDNRVWGKLPSWLGGMGRNFLTQLQICHDEYKFSHCKKDDVTTLMEEFVDFDRIVFPE